MIPISWIMVSIVILSHCLLVWEAELLLLHRVTRALIVARLQVNVVPRDRRPREAKVAAKTMFPGALWSVLMKHQVPGHCNVYCPNPIVGKRAKPSTAPQMHSNTVTVALVLMLLEYQ